MDDDGLITLAAGLARRAADAVMAVRAAGFAVERKRDFSPVTAADRIAEALIVEGLREATPAIPVIAEEEIAAGQLTELGAVRFWLVDPLDGTREFAAGTGNFTINIGLIDAGRPILGVVALPAQAEFFAGRVGAGAWKEDAAGRRTIAARRVPPEGPVIVASSHHAADPRNAEFARAHGAQKVLKIGSSEKFCRLAEGVADFYPRFGTMMEWDTAAPEAVLIAAGGSMAGWDGELLRYGKPDWRTPPFLARGRP
jgi:3'(2'), 5'-bisphosphate nucleotidase